MLLNEQLSRINDTLTRMGSILPAVIDYVAGLSGFKSKYAAEAAAYAAAKEEQNTVEGDVEALKEDDWFQRLGEPVVAGDNVTHLGVTYEVIQPHNLSAAWVPGQCPALYKVAPDPGEEWPEFVQPTGSHDAYKKGDKVTYKGAHYVSLIDANVWAPDAYPQGWELNP